VPAAQASFHEVDVREVYTGSATNPTADYVELEMWAAGQNFVSNGQLSVYNANGTLNHAYTPTGDVASGANNATFLIAGPAFHTEFPTKTADFTDASLDMSSAGGAVCWPTNSAPIDCASWGNFTGTLPSPAGTPVSASGISAGKAIQRSIAPGCPTLLEQGDDTDSSATDFSEVAPAPRVNADTITEATCPTMSVAVNGPGVVTSDGPGINCPGDCSQSYSGGPTVTLTAAPVPGATFGGWAGDCGGSPGTTCVLNMATNHAAIANFSSPTTAGSGTPAPTTPAPKKCKKHQKLKKGKCIKKKHKKP
jgi:hypothetical protein